MRQYFYLQCDDGSCDDDGGDDGGDSGDDGSGDGDVGDGGGGGDSGDGGGGLLCSEQLCSRCDGPHCVVGETSRLQLAV